MTSLLKEATYIVRKSGKKDMFKEVDMIAKSEKLKKMLNDGFVKDCGCYNKVKLFVACGPKVYDKLLELKGTGVFHVPVIGIAHPSGANLGRVLCYLGQKEVQDSSYEWCREKAEEAKAIISGFL